ncbi:MAG: tRNA (adenosine(37)-N6)-threonylcarbamoyltransferase complex transferase subunit TsaD [Bacteroidota bacterium]|jgi:N6-L-threonylcarbamoyladenine synthase|nr:tRNA (adenosine(37)-N6)-threonylcarbamoyltransferase complex transferase subunit TsaD [Ignavibacteria bacterium]HEX2960293.1 tRNA (adenosine(37)-N6)-threonylcarbamoyltransferase complex transferase subunit TsaD [Ignavibacteriales bacterium]MCU7500398.1 tRNA (adenosine(37)-N6)-threonylcarbamoyltransferase complex transferase subunit TsaD [Ignavibacteria bacterium]MCU7512754.1 tRNA (adenosine(37)-N6)-threonylcarbamoyltransferase complex transferase subunit TsaD [Ignavibacteria bacterium]MCU752
MNVIGIESSCDETSVAVIRDGKLTSNLISSQDFHVNYGGVVPELSSRAHLQIIIPLLKDSLRQSGISLNDVDVVCATAGPGLIGALLVGLTFGKSLAYSLNKPFIPVNHIEGHIFSGFLMEEKPEFPYLALVVSGGHTLLLIVKSDTEIIKLGTTVDDAAGEAFDKVAKMLGLGYPGGPKIQKSASLGNPEKIQFPIASLKNPYDFSFSGLKTAVLRYLQQTYGKDKKVPEEDLPDIAASFQRAVIKALVRNVEKALKEYKVNSLSLVGGVAANKALRDAMAEAASKYRKKLVIPDFIYCGDNAAMIAYRGQRLFQNGNKYSLDYNAFPGLPSNTFAG